MQAIGEWRHELLKCDIIVCTALDDGRVVKRMIEVWDHGNELRVNEVQKSGALDYQSTGSKLDGVQGMAG